MRAARVARVRCRGQTVWCLQGTPAGTRQRARSLLSPERLRLIPAIAQEDAVDDVEEGRRARTADDEGTGATDPLQLRLLTCAHLCFAVPRQLRCAGRQSVARPREGAQVRGPEAEGWARREGAATLRPDSVQSAEQTSAFGRRARSATLGVTRGVTAAAAPSTAAGSTRRWTGPTTSSTVGLWPSFYSGRDQKQRAPCKRREEPVLIQSRSDGAASSQLACPSASIGWSMVVPGVLMSPGEGGSGGGSSLTEGTRNCLKIARIMLMLVCRQGPPSNVSLCVRTRF